MDNITAQRRVLEENIQILKNFIQTATERTNALVDYALQELTSRTEKEKEKLIESCNELKESCEEEFKNALISSNPPPELFPLTLSLETDEFKIKQAVQESFTFNMYSYQNSLKELHRVSMRDSSYIKYNVRTGEVFSVNTPFASCIAPSLTPLDNGNIFLSGGINWQSFQAMARVIEYDPNRNIAYGRPNLNRPRGYHSAHKFKNKIFVFGGSDSDSFSAKAIKEIEEYDIVKEEWKVIGELITERTCTGIAEYNEKLYITGGWGSTASIEIFDLNDYSITKAEPILDVPGPSIAVTLTNFILIIHGKHVSKYFPDRNRIVSDGLVEFQDLGLFTSSPPVCYQNKLYFTGNWQHEGYNVYDIISHQLTDIQLF